MATPVPSVLRQLTVPRDALRPPSADNPRIGVVMSLIAHAALVTALALGVSWRTQEPSGVEAELWAATPQLAAPPRPEADAAPPMERERAPESAPTTPPPPAAAERDAEIALEKATQERKEQERREAEDRRARERRQQEEKDRLATQKAQDQTRRQQEQDKVERDRRDKADQVQREKVAEAQREKLRQDQIRRMNDQLGGTGAPGSTGTAPRDAGPSANYAGRIKARIKPNIVFTEVLTTNPVAEVEVRTAADGSILGQRILKSSGVKAWDDAVLRAVERTGMLPRDTDGRIPSTLVISFRLFE